MPSSDSLDSADARIQEHRTAEAQLSFVDEAGQAVGNLTARVRLVRHEFKLGCNAFKVCSGTEPGLLRAYEDRFAALLNYATLPFYWGGYEPEKGRTSEERLAAMAEWCASHHITAKGHPLVWHEVFPPWAADLDDGAVLERLEARVRDIVARFRGQIDLWDVVNEATVSHRFENAIGRWMGANGAAACVAQALEWAHAANPDAVLLYNDFNVSGDFEALVAGLQERNAPVGTLGIQSHMHKGNWPVGRASQVCDTYARFGLPLHFTELTIVSGRYKTPEDNDWHRRHTDWLTTPEGEARQLEFGRQFYAALFAHPAVEAITWWDFSDHESWQGAPAGLVRSDMSPKPLYEWLLGAFHTRWSTDATARVDADGRAAVRCFFGDHEVETTLGSGATLRGVFSLHRHGARELQVLLS